MGYAKAFLPVVCIVCASAPSFGQTQGDGKLEGLLRHEPLFWFSDEAMARAALERLLGGHIWSQDDIALLDRLIGDQARWRVKYAIGGDKDMERRFRRMLEKRIKRLAPLASAWEVDRVVKEMTWRTMRGL